MMNRHSHLAGQRVGDADGIANDYQGQEYLDGAGADQLLAEDRNDSAANGNAWRIAA